MSIRVNVGIKLNFFRHRCPPGGSSFTIAWSLTCSMRRKREITSLSSLIGVFTYQILLNIINLLTEPHTFTSLWALYSVEVFFKLVELIIELVMCYCYFTTILSSFGFSDPKDKRKLIVPSMQQLQWICCNEGCSANDILSFCAPQTLFGK